MKALKHQPANRQEVCKTVVVPSDEFVSFLFGYLPSWQRARRRVAAGS
jgi:hypothetical protein